MNNLYHNFSRQSPFGYLLIFVNQVYGFFKFFWFLLFLVIKDFSKITNLNQYIIPLSLIVLLFIFSTTAYLKFKNFQFKISEDAFILKQGIISKKLIEIKLKRIQNIHFEQNIIHQIFNVYQFKIETAGSDKEEVIINALKLVDATALKSILLATSFEVENCKLEQLSQSKPLLFVPVKNLLKVGLSENHFRNLLVVFVFILSLYSQIDDVLKELKINLQIGSVLETNFKQLSESLILIISFLIFILILSLLISLIKVFLIHFNLYARNNGTSIEISQGLFTQKTLMLTKSKVQSIIVNTNPIKKLFGISTIFFHQALGGKNQKNEQKQIKIVGCDFALQNELTSMYLINDKIDDEPINKPNKYFYKRNYFYALLFVLIFYSVFFYFFTHFEIVYTLFVVLPVVLFLVNRKNKKRYFKISKDAILINQGIIENFTQYQKLYKIQNIEMKQSFFERRRNLASINLQTASFDISIPCIEIKDATFIYNYILFKIQSTQKLWL